MHFQPSPLSYGEPYGFLGMSKAQRRDARMREAARKMEKYEKCIAKGKGSKCDKYKQSAKKKTAKAKKLDEKLYVKGKGKSLIEREERGVETTPESKGFKKGPKGRKGSKGSRKDFMMKAGSGRAAAPGEMPIEDAEMTAESTGGSGMLLPVIGLLMVSGIGFFVWKRKKG